MTEFLSEYLSEDTQRAIAIGTFSLLVPIGVYVGRMNVRASRREIVVDLERLFQFAKADGRPIILPSFELVKYKYDPESNPERSTHHATNANSIRYYIFPVLIYVLLTFLCFEFAFTPRRPDQLSFYANPVGWQGMVTYTFLGSYIWTLQYLVRRIANFDLSPISFFAFLSTRHVGVIRECRGGTERHPGADWRKTADSSRVHRRLRPRPFHQRADREIPLARRARPCRKNCLST